MPPIDQSQQNPVQVPVNSPGPTTASNLGATPPPVPKKSFPTKMVLIVVGILVLLGIVGFIVMKLMGEKIGAPTELTWWGLWEDQNIVASLIAEYEAANPRVKINYIRQSPKDYRERLANSIAKGTAPDIFRFHNTWTPMFKNDLDAVPSSVMSAADFAKNYYPVAVSDLSSSGKIIGIPLEYDGLVMYINEDIFNKAGKSVPTTWDDLRQVAKELTVIDDQGIITQSGVAMGRVENVDHWEEILALLMVQNGVDLNSPTTKNAGDALKFFAVFSITDGVWDATLPKSTAAFAGGKLAIYFGPSWRSFEINLANPNLKYKTYPVPQLPKDNPNDPDVTYATYWNEGVWAKSPNKAQAWDFVKFLSTRSSLEKFYANAAKVRGFGEPYPRIEMASLLSNHPVVGALLKQAPGAKSWYLASRTFDGPTGINSLLSKYFEDAVNSVIGSKQIDDILETLSQGVGQVLTQYRLVAK